MKRTLLLTAGLALVLLTGCVTLSIYPYYTAKDVVFDPALIGVWADPDKTNADHDTWSFEKSDDQAYKLTITDNDKKTEFDARLFKLKDHTFIDCLPRERPDYSTPCHMLLRVDHLQPTLEMHLLDYDWLGKLIEKQPKAIRHALIEKAGGKAGDHDGFVLTADTAELQKFILKHIKLKEAWGDALIMKRQ